MNYEYCDGITYTIKKGDTLYEISRKHNVALALLLRANPYIDVFNLQIGDTICIPTAPQMSPSVDMGGLQPVSPENMENQQMAPLSENEKLMQESDELHRNMDEEMEENDMVTGRWEKYVVQPGDTLEDVMRGMDGNAEKFLEKNSPAGIYMLPGVAYYIFMEED